MGTTAAQRAPSGAGGFDMHDYRTALGTFGTGVTIVTTRNRSGDLFGLTANSFSSVSLDPPLVLWSQSLCAPSLRVFEESPHFAINVLGSEHRDLSTRFAGTSAMALGNKFAGVEYTFGAHGIPLITGAAAHFECRTEKRFEGGDHVIILGRVEHYRYVHKPTLFFCHGKYHRAHPLED